jgi:ferredoxin--NADP+ reductase
VRLIYKIIKKVKVTPHIFMFDVYAPAVAKKSKPGQFVIIRTHDFGERIPITIAGTDPESCAVKIYVAEVGVSSREICALKEGSEILNFSGPLGNSTAIKNYGTIIVIGGAAFIGAHNYMIHALKKAGNEIFSIITVNKPDELFLIDEIDKKSVEIKLVIEDGSGDFDSLDFLNDLFIENKIDHIFTIGPTSMQKSVSEISKPLGIPTTVNLFPIMVDGTGMCGACRVTVGGTTKFACVDGPDFDGHQVDFDELISRMRYYTPQEKIAMILKDKGVI